MERCTRRQHSSLRFEAEDLRDDEEILTSAQIDEHVQEREGQKIDLKETMIVDLVSVFSEYSERVNGRENDLVAVKRTRKFLTNICLMQ